MTVRALRTVDRSRLVALFGRVFAIFTLISACVLTILLVVYSNAPSNRPFTQFHRSDIAAIEVAAGLRGEQPILTTSTLGAAVPMLVDAPTFVGNQFWTPDYFPRANRTFWFFTRQRSARSQRAFVRSTKANVIVEPCGIGVELRAELKPLGFRERQVGCARVFWRKSPRP